MLFCQQYLSASIAESNTTKGIACSDANICKACGYFPSRPHGQELGQEGLSANL